MSDSGLRVNKSPDPDPILVKRPGSDRQETPDPPIWKTSRIPIRSNTV